MIVEKPIERITEVEIDVEKIVHREYEKIVEIPIEKIVEIPVENVIERPVETVRYVDVPYEIHHEHRVEEIHENVIVHENV